MSRRVTLRGRVLLRRRSRAAAASSSLSHDLFICLLNPPALLPPAGHQGERSRAAVLPSRLLARRPSACPLTLSTDPPPPRAVNDCVTYLGIRGRTLAVAAARSPPWTSGPVIQPC